MPKGYPKNGVNTGRFGEKNPSPYKGKTPPHFVGDKNPAWKGGVSSDKKYRSWVKNQRNHIIRSPEKGTHTYGDWDNLKLQYNHTCPSCKISEPKIKLTQDHIIPLSKGGSNRIENIQPLCRTCNFKKHTKIIKFNL